jgi:threonine aldolase
VLLHQDAHPFHYEGAGSAVVGGVQLRTLPGPRGVMDPDDLAAAVRPADPHYPHTALLCVEDTHNRGGGSLQPPANTARLLAVARSHGMSAHLDGARVFNAAVAAGTTVAERARGFDTVSFCFSKALGCPAGSVVCGDRDRMAHARRHRKMLGGAMRQSGMLAGAALYALDHHVARLADDHRRARELAAGLVDLGLDVQAPESNIVVVGVPRASTVAPRLEERGVRCFAIGPDRLRLVVHLGITDAMIPLTIDAFRQVAAIS